jgi:hypothetical protein
VLDTVSLNVIAHRCYSLSLKNMTTSCSSIASSVSAMPFFASIARNMLRVRSVIRAAYRAVPPPTAVIFTRGGKRCDDGDLLRVKRASTTLQRPLEPFNLFFSTYVKQSRAQPHNSTTSVKFYFAKESWYNFANLTRTVAPKPMSTLVDP